MQSNNILSGRNTISNVPQRVIQSGASFVVDVGIQLFADKANNGNIYIGGSNSITSGITPNTDGFPLASGEFLFCPVRRSEQIWAVAQPSGQTIWWMAF